MTQQHPAAAPPARPQASLDNAPPTTPAPAPTPQPATAVALTAHVESPKGISMDLTIRNVVWEQLPGVTARALKFEEQLLKDGFKPLAPPVMAAPAAGTSGETGVLLVQEDGTRSCSLHGPGRYSPPAPNPRGGMYAGRWWCNDRNCKAKEAKPA